MIDCNFELKFGPVTLKLANGMLMLFVPPESSLPKGKYPSLHKGLRAHHLTIPLELRKHGEHAGLYNIHLTYPDGHRRTIATPSPEQMEKFGQQLEANLGELYLERLSPVTSDELAAAGYELIFFDEHFPALLQQTFQVRRRTYRVSQERMNTVLGEGWIAEPGLLDSEELALAKLASRSVGAIPSERDAQSPSFMLHHHPEGIGECSPGWYALPSNWISREFFAGQLQQLVGPRLWEFIRDAATELGLDLDFGLLDKLLTQAPAR